MIISDVAVSRGDIMRRLEEIEARLREMDAGRRLEAATIGAGGLTVDGGEIRVLDDGGGSVELGGGRLAVRDAAGNVIIELGKAIDARYGLRVNNAEGAPQIRAGELAAGGYGLEAVDEAGQLVKLSALAFGPKSHSRLGDALVTATAFVSATPTLNRGPIVPDVPIGDTGRCIVTLTTSMIVQDEAAHMGVDISGPTSVPPATDWAVHFSNASHVDTETSAIGLSKTFIVEGLDPGLYTFEAMYKTAGGNQVDFFHRHVLVQPF